MRKSATILTCISVVILLFASLSWAGNWVTKSYGQYKAPQFTPFLKNLIKAGNVYDMGVVRSADMPMWPGHPKFLVLNYKFHGETKELEPATYENDMVVMCSHSGTHMDAVTHIGERRPDGKIAIYGGKTADQIKEWWSLIPITSNPILVLKRLVFPCQFKPIFISFTDPNSSKNIDI